MSLYQSTNTKNGEQIFAASPSGTSHRLHFPANVIIPLSRLFPSLSGKSSIRTLSEFLKFGSFEIPSFHPFQGRAPFGQILKIAKQIEAETKFPSLSGKTSIRTDETCPLRYPPHVRVSIPFREDLYSDATVERSVVTWQRVSIPFREDLYSDH